MFYKLLGYMLIILAGTGFGYSKSLEMKRHLQELEEIRHLFGLFRGELKYTQGTFGEIFERIGDKTDGKFKEWLKTLSKMLNEKTGESFACVWEKSIDVKLRESHLKEKDLEELKRIGKNLASLESVDLYIEQLGYDIQNKREMYKTKGKLCKSMGIMGGIFVVILLL